MSISWRSSRDVFVQILARRGLDPSAVDSVESAWAAFEEFMELEISGIEDVSADGDGFIAEWGIWSWTEERLPAFSFGRLLAVNDYAGSDRADSFWQPQHWRVDLEISFPAHPEFAGVDELGFQDTGFDFYEIGPARTAALAEARAFIHSYPKLAAMWNTKPIRSRLTLEQAD